MKKTSLGLALALLATVTMLAATPDKWLHIKVDNTGDKTERVRVNVPLDFLEKVIPAINQEHLHAGHLHLGQAKVNDVDLRVVLEAVRSSKDNEFVTVESDHENVRVAKQGGYLVIKVAENKRPNKKESKVDVSVPISVVEALLSGDKGELDLVGAIRALAEHGDTVLVTVSDGTNNVRIWVDSQSSAQ